MWFSLIFCSNGIICIHGDIKELYKKSLRIIADWLELNVAHNKYMQINFDGEEAFLTLPHLMITL